jgi:hypothetical protein
MPAALARLNFIWPIELAGPGRWRTLTVARPSATACQSTLSGGSTCASALKLETTS